nr:hypothetical protein [uncultured Porphyromonas sp.]
MNRPSTEMKIRGLNESMIHYVGTKEIRATPMSRRDYNDLRGWTLPEDEDGDDEGYLVEYTDGGKANVEGFRGYISWSPKDVFERAYNPQESYEDRIRVKLKDVKRDISILGDTVRIGEHYGDLDAKEKKIITEQIRLLKRYEILLRDRLQYRMKKRYNERQE